MDYDIAAVVGVGGTAGVWNWIRYLALRVVVCRRDALDRARLRTDAPTE